MADFKTSFLKSMHHEAGYANHPADRGGETYRGIARRKHHAWKGWRIIDGYKSIAEFEAKLDTDTGLQMLVDAFYKTMFWDDLYLDKINSQEIADELFDTAINMGGSIAVKFLQEALNLLNKNGKSFIDIKVDGVMGPNTIAMANKYPNEKALLKTLNGLQFGRYRNICNEDPTQEVFFLGWLNRV
jgi:lysozyme family protein